MGCNYLSLPLIHASGKTFLIYGPGCIISLYISGSRDWTILHYNDVIMGAMVSKITGLTIVYSTVYSGADQRKHQSSASLAYVRGNHQWPVNVPHKWPVTRKMFPFDDVIMTKTNLTTTKHQTCAYFEGYTAGLMRYGWSACCECFTSCSIFKYMLSWKHVFLWYHVLIPRFLPTALIRCYDNDIV